MPAYRFYTLPRDSSATPAEGRFYSDAVALLWALRSSGRHGFEVWEGSRFVGRIHGGVTSIAADFELDAGEDAAAA